MMRVLTAVQHEHTVQACSQFLQKWIGQQQSVVNYADQHWNEPNAQACHMLHGKTAAPCLQPPAIVPAPLFWEIHPKPCAVELSNDECVCQTASLSAVRWSKYKIIAGVKASTRTCMLVRPEPIHYALPSSTRPEWLAHNYVLKPKAECPLYMSS